MEGGAVGRFCERQLIVLFLYLAQTDCSGERVDRIPERRTAGNDVAIGLAGRCTISLQLIGMSQRIGRSSAGGQVVEGQILQGATRLDNDRSNIVLDDRQRRS